jgi:hypothetical protein
MVITAAVLSLVGAGITLVGNTSAQAQAGNRLCWYDWLGETSVPEARDPSTIRHIVYKVKKGGSCPAGMQTSDPEVTAKVAGGASTRVTCEEFAEHQKVRMDYDPCFLLERGRVYTIGVPGTYRPGKDHYVWNPDYPRAKEADKIRDLSPA